jgi:energy-coupling factor transporter ATP-binding protein EcfA2
VADTKSNTKRYKSDSWIDNTEIKDPSFLGRKRVDYSTFEFGTTIPERYHRVFLSNLSKELSIGERVNVKIILGGKDYNARVRWPNSAGRTGVIIQLLYSDKALKELLQEKLDVSYEYIMNYLKVNAKKPTQFPEEYAEYIDIYKGDKKDTFIFKLITKIAEITEDEDLDEDSLEDIDEPSEFYTVKAINDELKFIHDYIADKGFTYSQELINNFYLCLKTKPFVILSGISGTGKSKIVQLFAEAVGANYDNGRFRLISVRPDWSDATDLLGYRNIENQFTPGIITSIAYEAMLHPKSPYFICLDEMNLARVEYYFSDLLSKMETRRKNEDGEIITEVLISKEQFGRDEKAASKFGDVYIPQNLYIIGTVNMDETTFPFSKKVLDRANTIEFNKVNLEYNFEELFTASFNSRNYHNDFLRPEYIKLMDCIGEKELAKRTINELIKINDILEDYNFHFGYRVRDEIVFYIIYAVKNGIMEFEAALDLCIIQKVLPKLSGSAKEVLDALVDLYNLLNGTKYKKDGFIEENQFKAMEEEIKNSKYVLTGEKLIYMMRRFIRDGFTTFWQ